MKADYSVALTPIFEDDYELLSTWSSSPSWVYASGTRQFMSPSEFKEFTKQVKDTFLIVRTREGQAIGTVSYRNIGAPGNFVVGSMIGDAEMWGMGFGVESVMLLVDILFNSKNAHRVEFTCGLYNKGAIHNFCSGFMQIEGILRDYHFIDGTYYDAVIGSILRDEYYSMMPASETVPTEEKDEARKLLDEYLESHPITLRQE
ncbi:Protein N-acetyltransferase, RimJ/RimL family [Actinomadura madurae]|uniref:Protein N-acetyltransferase, RimJ/RimL family n=1 Tax=Actinomadura madurae TaxID=1993 RepID=A0A1I5ID03_9ACTN|nr:GNAT family protein [Actinomadura madurae]SFO58465.1 Protein N-acetyltransferase, RimJ/RimL family [Actinomadura madurae]